MSACAAVGCSKHQRRDKDVIFFNLPKTKTLASKWIKRIKNKRKDELPKKIVLCENHFSDEMFDKSIDMQNQFLQEMGSRRRRKLISNAFPDILPYSIAQNVTTRQNVMTKVRKRQMIQSLIDDTDPQDDPPQDPPQSSSSPTRPPPASDYAQFSPRTKCTPSSEKSTQTDSQIKVEEFWSKEVQMDGESCDASTQTTDIKHDEYF